MAFPSSSSSETALNGGTSGRYDDKYLFLVEFAHKHLDFHLAELRSVLEIYDIALDGPVCQTVPLPNEQQHDKDGNPATPKPTTTTTTTENNNNGHSAATPHQRRRPFTILSFSFDAIAATSSARQKLFRKEKRRHKKKKTREDAADNTTTTTTDNNDDDATASSSPPSAAALLSATISAVLSRCVLVKRVIELWGMGTTLLSCAEFTKKRVRESAIGRELHRNHKSPSQSWKATVHTLGSKHTREEQDAMRLEFSFLDFPGRVQMKDPDYEFLYILENELDSRGCPSVAEENSASLASYFGKVLNHDDTRNTATTTTTRTRGQLEQYSLKKRSYLGPTSMDTELSFIMTNLGRVKKGSVVLDPFVGTGSILVTCAIQGAYCVGTDIDIRVLRGKEQPIVEDNNSNNNNKRSNKKTTATTTTAAKKENVYSNFKQYNLPRPELIRSDNAIYHRHYKDHMLYDAIICDPPYGIRAGARQTGSRLENPKPVLEHERHDHIAQTKPYVVSDVMSDLLDMAARTLVMGGFLVYIIPSFSQFDASNDLPRHDCLRLVHCCYQPLSLELGRSMVAMKKTEAYDPSRREHYFSRVWKNGPESANKCANLRDKILEAAKLKPGYEERAAIRKRKRKANKDAKKRAKLALNYNNNNSKSSINNSSSSSNNNNNNNT